MIPLSTQTVLVQVQDLRIGGSQMNALDLAAAVRGFGFDPVVVGPGETAVPGNNILGIAEELGIPVEVLERPRSEIHRARMLSRIADDRQVDLVHVYGSGNGRAAFWGPCRLARRPLVLTVYEMSVPASTYKGVDLVVGTRYLEEDLTRSRTRVHLISPPVDTRRDSYDNVDAAAFRHAVGLADSTVVVVIVSRLARAMKALGIEAVIEAIGARSHIDWHLCIVGDGDAEAALRARANEVNDRVGRPMVTLLGPMPDPRPAYAAADIVVGMGGSAARGLAFGRPVVVSGEYGYFERVTEENIDQVFERSFWNGVDAPSPVDSFWATVEPLLRDAELRQGLGSFGRRFAIASFDLQSMAQRLASIYDEAARNYGRRQWGRDLPIEFGAAGRRVERAVSQRLKIRGVLP